MDDIMDADSLMRQDESLGLMPTGKPDPDATASQRAVAGEPIRAASERQERPTWPERVAAIGDLTRLLTEAGTREVLARRALDFGVQLLGPDYSWRLLAVDAALEQAAVTIAEAGARLAHGTPQPGVLGYGEEVDRRALRGRRSVLMDRTGAPLDGSFGPAKTPARIFVCPLVDSGDTLWGVLVVRADERAPGLDKTDQILADAVGHTLTALLSQGGRADTRAERSPRDVQDTQDGRDERDEFVSLAAHELRSPLTTVKGYAQLLLRAARRDPGPSGNTERALMAIEQQATRMSDMVAELLDSSRITRGAFEVHPRLVVLDTIVRRAVEQRRSELERHAIELEMEATGLVGRWDGGRVEQAVRDLLDNAIRFSPGGGSVRVRVSQAGGMARVCVRDSGIGIAADEAERIFELYFRGREAQRRNLSGLGLGLFVSRTIAERMGGTLSVERGLGSGTTFCLALPLATPARTGPEARPGKYEDDAPSAPTARRE